MIDDSGGNYALRFLKGHGRGLTKLAQRYKSAEDAEILSRFTHADVRGLAALHLRSPARSGPIEEGEITILPARDDQQATLALYALAYEAIEMSGLLAEAFDLAFEIPPWVARELRQQGEAFAELERSTSRRVPTG